MKKTFVAKSARVWTDQNISSLDNIERVWHRVELKYMDGKTKTVAVMAKDPLDAIAYCNGCSDHEFDNVPFNNSSN